MNVLQLSYKEIIFICRDIPQPQVISGRFPNGHKSISHNKKYELCTAKTQ